MLSPVKIDQIFAKFSFKDTKYNKSTKYSSNTQIEALENIVIIIIYHIMFQFNTSEIINLTIKMEN
jgi:hypothetical protein